VAVNLTTVNTEMALWV